MSAEQKILSKNGILYYAVLFAKNAINEVN
jgi:hypothetical protein